MGKPVAGAGTTPHPNTPDTPVPPKDKPPKDNTDGDSGGGGLSSLIGGNPTDRVTVEMSSAITQVVNLSDKQAGRLPALQNTLATAASESHQLNSKFADENNGNFSI